MKKISPSHEQIREANIEPNQQAMGKMHPWFVYGCIVVVVFFAAYSFYRYNVLGEDIGLAMTRGFREAFLLFTLNALFLASTMVFALILFAFFIYTSIGFYSEVETDIVMILTLTAVQFAAVFGWKYLMLWYFDFQQWTIFFVKTTIALAFLLFSYDIIMNELSSSPMY
ncbi:MAG: hypothetical protein OEZ43_05755 [Gammaproteobacteria bacterium]|nr:hypothetical protein [Gammaproteobacteria bacterium]